MTKPSTGHTSNRGLGTSVLPGVAEKTYHPGRRAKRKMTQDQLFFCTKNMATFCFTKKNGS